MKFLWNMHQEAEFVDLGSDGILQGRTSAASRCCSFNSGGSTSDFYNPRKSNRNFGWIGASRSAFYDVTKLRICAIMVRLLCWHGAIWVHFQLLVYHTSCVIAVGVHFSSSPTFRIICPTEYCTRPLFGWMALAMNFYAYHICHSFRYWIWCIQIPW